MNSTNIEFILVTRCNLSCCKHTIVNSGLSCELSATLSPGLRANSSDEFSNLRCRSLATASCKQHSASINHSQADRVTQCDAACHTEPWQIGASHPPLRLAASTKHDQVHPCSSEEYRYLHAHYLMMSLRIDKARHACRSGMFLMRMMKR